MPTDTKTALLNSAEHAARTSGFDGFSYADLAKDVGIRKASIHHHFPTKAALCLAIMQRYHTDFETACANIDAEKMTAHARLQALVARYRAALDDGRSLCLCVSLSASCDSLSPDVIQQISRFRSMIRAWLQTTFELGRHDGTLPDAPDAARAAASALALLEGAQLAARAAKDPALFDNALHLLTQKPTQT